MSGKFLNKLLSQPVFRIQILGFLIVAIVPIIFLSINIYRLTWEGEWREIREKHQLLAENLASPVYNYVAHHLSALAVLAKDADGSNLVGSDLFKLTKLVRAEFSGFEVISLVGTDGKILFTVDGAGGSQRASEITANYTDVMSYKRTLESRKHEISDIVLSPLTSKPAIIITQPVFSKAGVLTGVLLAELKIDEIERLRSQIHFGEKGHSAIVDSRGRVIAHPNPEWMEKMKDLSHLSVVKAMMAKKTGVTEFYSPLVKQNMVAGYTSVPGIGWGIMVPQPKSEVEAQVSAIMASHIDWILAGFFLAISLALILVYWITRPINLLSDSARHLAKNSFEGDLIDTSQGAPREIKQLGDSMNALITGLQSSREEVHVLNEVLQIQVDETTGELLEANRELKRLADSDFLTSLANRRYFMNELAINIGRRSTDDLSILMIDIDNFKDINDEYGHAAGDAVLVQLSGLLNTLMRDNNLLARYGGDEIVVQLQCNEEVARNRAENIRKKVEDNEFTWGDSVIRMTVSIGVLSCSDYTVDDIKKFLEKVDSALYKAKKSGRNVVIVYDADKL